jgi:hypothetical protein
MFQTLHGLHLVEEAFHSVPRRRIAKGCSSAYAFQCVQLEVSFAPDPVNLTIASATQSA